MEEFIEVEDSGGGTRPLYVPRGITHLDDTSETVETVGNLIGTSEDRLVLSGTDRFAITVSNILRSISWTNLKANLTGIFASLSGTSGGQKLIGGTQAADKLSLQGTSASGTTGSATAIELLTGDNGAKSAVVVRNDASLIIDGETIQTDSVRRIAMGKGALLGTCKGTYSSNPSAQTPRISEYHLTDNIGSGSFSGHEVVVSNGSTIGTGNLRAIVAECDAVAGSTVSGDLIGLFAVGENRANLGSVSYNAGVYSIASQIGVATCSQMNALAGDARVAAGAGVVSECWGTEGIIQSSGSITTGYGARGKLYLKLGSSIGTGYGLKAELQIQALSFICTDALYALHVSNSKQFTGTIPKWTAITASMDSTYATVTYGLEILGTAPSYIASKIGIGNGSPTAKFDVIATTEQLRLGYDATKYASFTVDSNANLKIGAPLTWRPAASATPAANGDLTFEITSNTQVTVKAKGSDGVVRSAVLTLS